MNKIFDKKWYCKNCGKRMRTNFITKKLGCNCKGEEK